MACVTPLSTPCFSPYLPQPRTRDSPGFCNASTTLTTQCSSRVDVAHLVLYHLSVCCKKKYFDFDREILPFTSENWDSLLLGEVRKSEGLGVRVEQGDVKKREREGSSSLEPIFPPSPQLSDTPKGERSSKLLSALNSHKDR